MGELRQIHKILDTSQIKYKGDYTLERLRHLAHLGTLKINSKSECFGDRDLTYVGENGKYPCHENSCNAALFCQELADYIKNFDSNSVGTVANVSSNQTLLPERGNSMGVEKDKYGFRSGSKSSKIAEILTTNSDLTRTKAVDLVVKINNVTPNTANVQIYSVKKKLSEQGIKVDFKREPRKPKAAVPEAPAAAPAPPAAPQG